MKVLKNYLYNTFYQVFSILIPLITVPYISRIFTPEQLGVNAYTFSIAQYFVLFASLGVNIYGNRTIAYIKENQRERIKTFWSIVFTILITTIVSLFIYIILVLFLAKENIVVYLIQSIYILSVAFDISWLFMGMEDFKKIVARNTLVKILGIICIFAFVKDSDDINKYILIMAIINLFGFVTMWIYLPQYIKGFYFNINDIKKHIIPIIKVYIPQVAVQIYVIMDKTMIGIFANEAQVGYYDMAQKIVKIVLSVVTSLGVVMVPHISSLLASDDYDGVKKSIDNAFKYMSYLAFPMAFGLALIAPKLSIWFFGQNYSETGILISYSAFIIIAITWSGIIGMQLLMPMMKEKEFTMSVISGAVVNVAANLLLIPKYGAMGAVVGSILAEFIVTIIQIFLIKKYLNVIYFILNTWKSLIAALMMYVIINFMTKSFDATIYTTFIQIVFGVVIYIISMFVLRSDIQIEFLKKFKNNKSI